MSVIKMTELDLAGKRVLIREDLNVPVKEGEVADDTRIRASLPTIEHAVKAGARVMLMSHLGRPQEGVYDKTYSLRPVADRLTTLLGRQVRLVTDWLDETPALKNGDVVLCENVRFNKGEGKDDDELAKKMAALCDVYAMDAFGTAHRAQASTHGVAKYAPVACAGPLLVAELEALRRALQEPARPMVAVVGGAKVSNKVIVLDTLLQKVDRLIVGGGIANTFIAAAGYNIGKSLYERDFVDEAKRLIERAQTRKVEIPIPLDVVCSKELSSTAVPELKKVTDIADDDMILDIGPETSATFVEILNRAATIVWNGPVGVFEFDQFSHGTERLSLAIAASRAFSIAGGGDTLAAIAKYKIADKISYISTGGGAFLEFLEGKTLPAVAVLEERAKQQQVIK